VEQETRLSYEQLTLFPSTGGGPLIKDLSATVPSGSRVLITGPNQAAASALFMATAGVAGSGTGRIVRPPSKGLGFLSERPYLPPGSLRQILQSDEKTTRASELDQRAIVMPLACHGTTLGSATVASFVEA